MRSSIFIAVLLMGCNLAISQQPGPCIYYVAGGNPGEGISGFEGNSCQLAGIKPNNCGEGVVNVAAPGGWAVWKCNGNDDTFLHFKEGAGKVFDTAIWDASSIFWMIEESYDMPSSARMSGNYDEHLCSQEGDCKPTPLPSANNINPGPQDYFCESVVEYEYWEYEDTIELNDEGFPSYDCVVDEYMVYGIGDPPGGGNQNPPPANDPNAPVADNGSDGTYSEYANAGCDEGDDQCLTAYYGGGSDYDDSGYDYDDSDYEYDGTDPSYDYDYNG